MPTPALAQPARRSNHVAAHIRHERVEAERGPVSILVNNAGIVRDNLLLRMREDEWRDVLEVDLTAVYLLTRQLLRGMVKMRFGRIINISSVAGVVGNPGQANYSAAKAGVIGFTKALAREIATRGITVNAVAPGFIETDMTRALGADVRSAVSAQVPARRFGTVQEVAAAVRFLASTEASYITGHVLHVDGGLAT